MKTLLLMLVACASVALAAQSPVSVTKANRTFTFSNVSNKPIILITGDLTFSGMKDVQPFVHEGLFGISPFKVGKSENFEDISGEATLTITFVQFVDGTTWGDPGCISARWALIRRNATLSYLRALASTGTEADFLEVLDKPQIDINVQQEQERYKKEVSVVGAVVVWTHVKSRWEVAQKRSTLWNF